MYWQLSGVVIVLGYLLGSLLEGRLLLIFVRLGRVHIYDVEYLRMMSCNDYDLCRGVRDMGTKVGELAI
jgi:hypothetical protein